MLGILRVASIEDPQRHLAVEPMRTKMLKAVKTDVHAASEDPFSVNLASGEPKTTRGLP